jgi:hypothetical protein
MIMTTNGTQTIALKDGHAELMGDGVAVVVQKDERGRAQSVVVTAEDLKALLAAVEG